MSNFEVGEEEAPFWRSKFVCSTFEIQEVSLSPLHQFEERGWQAFTPAAGTPARTGVSTTLASRHEATLGAGGEGDLESRPLAPKARLEVPKVLLQRLHRQTVEAAKVFEIHRGIGQRGADLLANRVPHLRTALA